MIDYHGSKLALIFDDNLLVYRRDNKPEIPFPGYWDFPGGGREGEESPEQCVLRELEEEFSIELTEDRLEYRRDYSVPYRSSLSCFFVAYGEMAEIESVVFGEEGQCWRLMTIKEYLAHKEGIPNLQDRLKDYLITSQ